MTRGARHELDFLIRDPRDGFDFACHGLSLGEIVPLLDPIGSDAKLTELEDWDHSCPDVDRMVLPHAIEDPDCFTQAYGVAAVPASDGLRLSAGDLATFMRAAGAGMTCDIDGTSPSGAWEVGTHDNHFTRVEGENGDLLRSLIAHAIHAFASRIVEHPSDVPEAIIDSVIETFRGLPVVCLAEPPPPPRLPWLAFLRGKQPMERVAIYQDSVLTIPLAPSTKSWVGRADAMTAAQQETILWLSHETRVGWTVNATSPWGA